MNGAVLRQFVKSGLLHIHTFVKHTNDTYLLVRQCVVIDDMALVRVLPYPLVDIVALISKHWCVGEHVKGIIQSFEVMPSLCFAPPFLGESRNTP